MSTACTHRNEVGVSPCQARGSSQMASAKRGQISQLHSATSTRKTDHRRDSVTGASMPYGEWTVGAAAHLAMPVSRTHRRQRAFLPYRSPCSVPPVTDEGQEDPGESPGAEHPQRTGGAGSVEAGSVEEGSGAQQAGAGSGRQELPDRAPQVWAEALRDEHVAMTARTVYARFRGNFV